MFFQESENTFKLQLSLEKVSVVILLFLWKLHVVFTSAYKQLETLHQETELGSVCLLAWMTKSFPAGMRT